MGGIAHSMTKMIGVDTGAVVWILVNAPLYHCSNSGVIITEVGGLEKLMVYLANSPMRQLSAEGVRNRDCSIPLSRIKRNRCLHKGLHEAQDPLVV